MPGFGSPCGACKFLRRKCVRSCVFAPYFCHEQGSTHFAAIHKVFGASNVSKLLMHLPVHDRFEAALTMSYEAQARIQDPIYGCVAHIFALQQQVITLQEQIASFNAQTTLNYQGFQAHEDVKIPQRFINEETTTTSVHFHSNGIQSSSHNHLSSSSIVDEFGFGVDESSLDSLIEDIGYLHQY